MQNKNACAYRSRLDSSAKSHSSDSIWLINNDYITNKSSIVKDKFILKILIDKKSFAYSSSAINNLI